MECMLLEAYGFIDPCRIHCRTCYSLRVTHYAGVICGLHVMAACMGVMHACECLDVVAGGLCIVRSLRVGYALHAACYTLCLISTCTAALLAGAWTLCQGCSTYTLHVIVSTLHMIYALHDILR